jgi:hypothetical protein
MKVFFPPKFELEKCTEKLQQAWPQILEEVKRRWKSLPNLNLPSLN